MGYSSFSFSFTFSSSASSSVQLHLYTTVVYDGSTTAMTSTTAMAGLLASGDLAAMLWHPDLSPIPRVFEALPMPRRTALHSPANTTVADPGLDEGYSETVKVK